MKEVVYGLYQVLTINHDSESSSLDLIATGTSQGALVDRFNEFMKTPKARITYGGKTAPEMRYGPSVTHTSMLDDGYIYEWEFYIAPTLQIDQRVELSDWINDDHCSFRIIKGGDPNNVADRVCFIEKTPRVRVAPFTTEDQEGQMKWLYGPKGSGGDLSTEKDIYGNYPPSREWCNKMLRQMGYILL